MVFLGKGNLKLWLWKAVHACAKRLTVEGTVGRPSKGQTAREAALAPSKLGFSGNILKDCLVPLPKPEVSRRKSRDRPLGSGKAAAVLASGGREAVCHV